MARDEYSDNFEYASSAVVQRSPEGVVITFTYGTGPVGQSIVLSPKVAVQLIAELESIAQESSLSTETARAFAEGTRHVWDTPEEDAAWADL